MTTTPAEQAPTFRDYAAGELRAHLGRQRMSARALALALGESHTWANRRITGAVALSTDDLERIAGVLGMTPLALLGVTGGPFSPVDGPSPGRARQGTMTTCSPRNQLHVVPELDAA